MKKSRGTRLRAWPVFFLALMACAKDGAILGGSAPAGTMQNVLDSGGMAGSQATGEKSGGKGSDTQENGGGGGGGSDDSSGLNPGIYNYGPLDAGSIGPIEDHPMHPANVLFGNAKILCREVGGRERLEFNVHAMYFAYDEKTQSEKYFDYPALGAIRFVDTEAKRYVEAMLEPYKSSRSQVYQMSLTRKNQVKAVFAVDLDSITPKKFKAYLNPEAQSVEAGEKPCPAYGYAVNDPRQGGNESVLRKRFCADSSWIEMSTISVMLGSDDIKDYAEDPSQVPPCPLINAAEIPVENVLQ